jgi:cellulose synthase/poly-beta-1,6-N-acetylglucosamine synthase-like glycosyltransferase
VRTPAESGWKAFFNQRIRWASKAVHYRDKRVFLVLLLVYAVNLGFLVLTVAGIVNAGWLMFLVLFLAAKVLIEFPFVNVVSIFFGRQALMKYFPLMQPLHILYTIAAGWLGRFGSYRWKSRVIKNKPAKSM